MIVISLCGGPNTGKSTAASGLFYRMKVEGLNVELVNEYAKEKVLEKHNNILEDQLYILAKQNRRIERLRGQFDFVITDSPLFLGLTYMPENYLKTFKPLVLDLWNTYDNMTFYLHNDGDLTFQQSGRLQTKESAKQKDNEIRMFVENNNIPYIPIKVKANNYHILTNHIDDIYCKVMEKYYGEKNASRD